MKYILTIMLLFSLAAYGQDKPFSNYTEHNGFIFVSGQIGGTTHPSFNDEATQALTNVATILKDAGSSMPQVVNVTVYLSDMKYFAAFNTIYKQYFKAPFPARTCVIVKDLVQHAHIEISVIAGKG